MQKCCGQLSTNYPCKHRVCIWGSNCRHVEKKEVDSRFTPQMHTGQPHDRHTGWKQDTQTIEREGLRIVIFYYKGAEAARAEKYNRASNINREIEYKKILNFLLHVIRSREEWTSHNKVKHIHCFFNWFSVKYQNNKSFCIELEALSPLFHASIPLGQTRVRSIAHIAMLSKSNK